MRTVLPLLLAVTACAAAPRHTTDVSARYDLDGTAMAQVVTDASAAHHYRVAVVEPSSTHPRMVLLPTDNLERSALTVHLNVQPAWENHFATCLGSCATTVEIRNASGGEGDADAVALLEEIRARAQTNRYLQR